MNAARIHDGLNYLSKLTMRRMFNVLRTLFSFYWSRLTGNVKHPGFPVSISIEPTTACNLGCPECPSGLKMFSRNTGNIRKEELHNWLNELSPCTTYVNFYFQGEPFIHPDFPDLIEMAAAKRLYSSTSTNAHFITDEMAVSIVKSGLDRLIISIDGITQEVYEQYRVHGKLNKVLEGTRHMVAARKSLRSRKPFLIFQFLVVRHNEHQIEGVKRLAADLGVDEVRFKTAQVYDYEKGNPLIPLNTRYSRYQKTLDGSYRVKSSLDNHCWRLWSGAVITWDGKVVPCCFDKDATHQLGDLRSNRFSEIWNGHAYRSFREKLLVSRKEIDICSNCSEGTKVWITEA
jgi:radical SAM protein with 4Fe4S-binding SPASM domain